MPDTQATQPNTATEPAFNGINGHAANGTTPLLGDANPLARLAGKYQDDPTWEEFMAILEENRRKDKEEINALLDAEEEAAKTKSRS